MNFKILFFKCFGSFLGFINSTMTPLALETKTREGINISKLFLHFNYYSWHILLPTMSRSVYEYQNFQNGCRCHGNGSSLKFLEKRKFPISQQLLRHYFWWRFHTYGKFENQHCLIIFTEKEQKSKHLKWKINSRDFVWETFVSLLWYRNFNLSCFNIFYLNLSCIIKITFILL